MMAPEISVALNTGAATGVEDLAWGARLHHQHRKEMGAKPGNPHAFPANQVRRACRGAAVVDPPRNGQPARCPRLFCGTGFEPLARVSRPA